MKRILAAFIVFSYFGMAKSTAQGIPALKFDLKKPAKFEEKKLGSEKSEDKKFTIPRKILQNTITHYNWQFNASEKLKGILERVVEEKKDDYTKLLPFYRFNTDDTQRDSLELDSVIYKSNAGILLHDLRNGWVDDLYLLMGKAYFYKKVYDSAFLTFQYINYAFSPKEKDGYDKIIGSNSNEGGNAFSIATPEKKSIPSKLMGRAPVRNESFIWLIKTHIALEEYVEAAGLIEVLKNDPAFPVRLHPQLEELQSLWFYKQSLYDSAAVHLEKAIEDYPKNDARARWEYLNAQLFELGGHPVKATEHFKYATNYTLDPILEVYARLNAIRQNRSDEKAIEENIAQLLQMTKKDRYSNYRDIIFYSIAKIELERSRNNAAIDYLLKSTQSLTQESADPYQHGRSFLLLGDLYYEKADYISAANSYDSVGTAEIIPDQDVFNARLEMLKSIVKEQLVINRQDSLQKIASLPEKEREDKVRKIAKTLRKLQGLQEEEPPTSPSGLPINSQASQPIESFDNNVKGEWYFYNTSLKSKGLQEFKSKWGNRPNVDNWRRMEGVSQSLQQQKITTDDVPSNASAAETEDGGTDISFEGLMSKLPLSEESMKTSTDSVAFSQVEIGKLLVNGVEDLEAAIAILENNILRYPGSERYEEAVKLLYYCYKKKGLLKKAEEVLKLLENTEKGKNYLKKLNNKDDPSVDRLQKKAMTASYEKIYSLFISGKFDEALKAKKNADSLYSNNYWTPQLLYIEAIYHIRQREDSLAFSGLQNILDLFPESPLSAKAANLQQVLKRRSEIEEHLKNLKVERPVEPEVRNIPDSESIVPKVEEKKVATIEKKITDPNEQTIKKPEPTNQLEELKIADTLKLESKKVDPTTKEQPKTVDTTRKEELKTTEAPKPKEEIKKTDSSNKIEPKKPEPIKAPAAIVAPPAVVVKKDTPQVPKPLFPKAAEVSHYVILVLDDVDPVYVSESKNAFNRYIKQRNNTVQIEVQTVNLNNKIRLVTIGTYSNEKEALELADQLKKSVQEIVPWLPVANYKFGVISIPNLQKLQETKEIEPYRKFLKENYPNRF